MSDFFHTLPLLLPDPIFGLQQDYRQDPRKDKINLGIGIYQTEDSCSYLFSSVAKAEERMSKKLLAKDYLPIQGSASFLDSSVPLLLGKQFRGLGFQTVGGTSALRLGADLLMQANRKIIAIPDPSWENHRQVFTQAGLKVLTYPYYDRDLNFLAWEKIEHALRSLPRKSTVLLHAAAHNPTGEDLSKDQWDQILKIIKEQELLPFFDCAYQGLGISLAEDAKSVQKAISELSHCLIAYSHSKNLGLYGERVGWLYLQGHHEKEFESVAKHTIRTSYSNPPLHGALLATEVLQSADLCQEWEEELAAIRARILASRCAFHAKLNDLGCGDHFAHLARQIGFFSLTGLTEKQVAALREKYGIYMPKSGRINIAGINQKNVEQIALAFANVADL